MTDVALKSLGLEIGELSEDPDRRPYDRKSKFSTQSAGVVESSSGKNWAIILAAGEGRRVREFGAGHGQSAPKQFWTFDGRTSMLRWAIERAASLVPRERIVTVVAAQHQKWWEPQLQDLSQDNVLVQHQNRGTAAGVLLPLLHIRSIDPDSRVILLPSDHYVANERRLLSALRTALSAVLPRSERAILLGVSAEAVDGGYGWIVPNSESAGPVKDVRSFVEKPTHEEAMRLFGDGALVNSFILVARTLSLLRFYETKLTALLDTLSDAWKSDNRHAALGEAYRDLPVADFSKDLLQEVPSQLGMVSVPVCGWSDLGTPPRVNRYLEETSNESKEVVSRKTRIHDLDPRNGASTLPQKIADSAALKSSLQEMSPGEEREAMPSEYWLG